MSTVKVSSDVGAPVEEVFACFTAIHDGAGPVTGIKGIQMLTPPPFRLGTRWHETRQVMGLLDDAEMEVTAFELNRAYTITHHKGGVRIDTVFTFDPIPEGTRVSVAFGFNEHGLPPGLLAPLEWAISGKVRDVLARDLADLKASVEMVASETAWASEGATPPIWGKR